MFLSTCLWFDSEAEEAAKFYTSIFKDGKLGKISRYGKAGFEIHRRPENSVMTAEFEIMGRKYGLSWQVVPNRLADKMTDQDQRKKDNMMNAFMKMKKFSISKLEEAYNI